MSGNVRSIAITFVSLFVLAGCTSSGSTPTDPSPSAEPTPGPTAVSTLAVATSTSASAATSSTRDAENEYVADRNAICEDASLDVAAVNAQYIDAPGATRAMLIEGLRLIREIVALAQEQLAALTVPPTFQAFVDAEIAAREDPVGKAAYDDLLRAIERGDDLEEAAAAFDAIVNPINAEREAREDAYGLVHCA